MFFTTKKMMQIGIVTSSYPLSSDDTVNAGVFVRDVAHQLASRGHIVHVLTPKKYGSVETSSQVAVDFLPWWGGAKDLASISMKNPLNLLRFSTLVASGLWNVSRYAAFHHLDTLLAMWAIPSGLFSWWAWKSLGIPYGVWALGSDIWARHKYPFGNAIVKRVLRDAKFRFADGMELTNEVERLAQHPCHFVPSVRHLPIANQTIQPAHLSEGETHFLFIGRYEKNKGPDILIDAMKLFLKNGNNAHLHLFGSGSLKHQLQAQIEDYQTYIHLEDYANPQTVISYAQSCDWLIIPSRIESIPLIFMDALQIGIPVIVSDVGDLGSLVHRFKIGMVVPPENPLALAEALQASLERPKTTFIDAWQAPRKLFNLNSSVTQVENALLSIRTPKS